MVSLPGATGRTLRLNWGGGAGKRLGPTGAAGPAGGGGGGGATADITAFVGDLPFDANDAALLAVFQPSFASSITSAKVRARGL